ncbi:hypothetical protein TRIUR3_09781 [Triticum urartu]|uniref:Uncharacterized protein n=1 Tax=Triticum urartu TaxID=4572 RepID=M8AQK0_TRIUA|nr:hypothetical protein TRIUR3_09781 [Triticum urartu]
MIAASGYNFCWNPHGFVQGKLYLVTTGRTEPYQPRNPDGLLEVDVATEEVRTHRLPFKYNQYHSAWDPPVITFEMSGRLGLVVDILKGEKTCFRKLQFWVLMSYPSLDSDNNRVSRQGGWRCQGVASND